MGNHVTIWYSKIAMLGWSMRCRSDRSHQGLNKGSKTILPNKSSSTSETWKVSFFSWSWFTMPLVAKAGILVAIIYFHTQPMLWAQKFCEDLVEGHYGGSSLCVLHYGSSVTGQSRAVLMLRNLLQPFATNTGEGSWKLGNSWDIIVYHTQWDGWKWIMNHPVAQSPCSTKQPEVTWRSVIGGRSGLLQVATPTWLIQRDACLMLFSVHGSSNTVNVLSSSWCTRFGTYLCVGMYACRLHALIAQICTYSYDSYDVYAFIDMHIDIFMRIQYIEIYMQLTNQSVSTLNIVVQKTACFNRTSDICALVIFEVQQGCWSPTSSA